MKVAFLFGWMTPEGRLDGSGIGSWPRKVLNDLCREVGLEPVANVYCYDKWMGPVDMAKEFKKDPLNAALLLRKKLGDAEAVVSFGPLATWIATAKSFDAFKGTHIETHNLGPKIKHVVPTFDPDIFAHKVWKNRADVLMALKKVQREVDRSEVRILIPETVVDVQDYLESIRSTVVSFDVETLFKQINEFSIAPSSTECLYVPIFTASGNCWTEEEEAAIWLALWKLSIRKDVAWVFHNCVYDLTYLDLFGIHPLGPIEDTMLQHHALNPEWRKSLGYLSSLHLNVPAWKHLRQKSKKLVNKRGELD